MENSAKEPRHFIKVILDKFGFDADESRSDKDNQNKLETHLPPFLDEEEDYDSFKPYLSNGTATPKAF